MLRLSSFGVNPAFLTPKSFHSYFPFFFVAVCFLIFVAGIFVYMKLLMKFATKETGDHPFST